MITIYLSSKAKSWYHISSKKQIDRAISSAVNAAFNNLNVTNDFERAVKQKVLLQESSKKYVLIRF